MEDQTHAFRTTDSSLAAYLRLQEITLHGIEFVDGQRGVFVFSPPLPGMVERFRSGAAMGSLRTYIAMYRDTLRLIHEERDKQKEAICSLTS